MSKRSRRRDTSDISNRRLPPALNNNFDVTKKNRRFAPDIRQVEDRRSWHPEGKRYVTPRSFESRTRIIAQPIYPAKQRRTKFNPPTFMPAQVLAFEQPQKVGVCVRRKQREEVLHAKKKTGKRGQKRPKWNYFSKVRCK